MKSTFETELKRCATAVEAHLQNVLTDQSQAGETVRPPRLMAAMRHGVLNGGKRVRPFLVLQSAALFNVPEKQAMATACALECLHCYSLVHDDLPAMDDDDLRRGEPTVHIAYDDATAILAGDALLTLAFDMVAGDTHIDDHQTARDLLSLLAKASGLGGMIGGQMLDIAAESETPNEADIRQLQAMKTGALIRYACEAGAVLGKATAQDRQRLRRYGEVIGSAFQLADDLLDVTADTQTMGKATGKDADRGKGTLIGIHGIDAVRAMLAQQVAEAQSLLEPFGSKGEILRETAGFIANRNN
ncbi:polyprenyl synthetase family protein [Pseudahrensia aquimaris]|uniref:Polyprenyl synthetase family protein n=1 Tax=Pseudahrensia aquimaris TaxID=744461 RepID=A0ABW3F8W9_9HYPH